MKNTQIKPRGKFFNQEPEEEDSLKTILDSLALRVSIAEGKIEKKIIKKYFSPPEKELR